MKLSFSDRYLPWLLASTVYCSLTLKNQTKSKLMQMKFLTAIASGLKKTHTHKYVPKII